MEYIKKGSGLFIGPLIHCVSTRTVFGTEEMSYPLVRILMEVSGLDAGNGFLPTNQSPLNKLTMEFRDKTITATLDFAIWLNEYYFIRTPFYEAVSQNKNLILHATGKLNLNSSNWTYTFLLKASLYDHFLL